MSERFHNVDQRRIAESIEAAAEAGTFSRTFLTVCDGCGEWVSGIWFVVPGSHARLCRRCAPPDIFTAKARTREVEANHA